MQVSGFNDIVLHLLKAGADPDPQSQVRIVVNRLHNCRRICHSLFIVHVLSIMLIAQLFCDYKSRLLLHQGVLWNQINIPVIASKKI